MMMVYRIVAAQYADKLTASGKAGRWNLPDEHVIYTACSRSLATLELLVNRSGIHPESSYKVMLIEIPKKYTTIKPQEFSDDWRSLAAYPLLQHAGSVWYHESTSLVLAVPSAVIPKEYNFLINTRHGDFDSHVHQADIEDYFWDERLGN